MLFVLLTMFVGVSIEMEVAVPKAADPPITSYMAISPIAPRRQNSKGKLWIHRGEFVESHNLRCVPTTSKAPGHVRPQDM